jgi:DNA-binding CsgD family transcriptional regulator
VGGKVIESQEQPPVAKRNTGAVHVGKGPHSKRSAIRIRAREREERALELRKAGATYKAIGDALGCHESTAYDAVKRGLDRLLERIHESVAEARALDLARIDRLTFALWPKASAGDAHAIDRVVRLMKRRAALLGLDAPTRIKGEISGPGGGPIPAAVAHVHFVIPSNGRELRPPPLRVVSGGKGEP